MLDILVVCMIGWIFGAGVEFGAIASHDIHPPGGGNRNLQLMHTSTTAVPVYI